MPNLKLISHHLCPYVQRAVIVLSEKGVLHQREYIDLANRPDWFADISPLGRVPLLVSDETVIFESQVIAEYLDEVTHGSLHPADPLEKARHRSWIEYGSETLAAIGEFCNAKDARSFEDRRQALAAKFERIDGEVKGPFFAGDKFHMIDGVWGTIFRYTDIFDEISDFDLLPDSEIMHQWKEKLSQRKSVKEAVPKGYPERLKVFLKTRNAHLATLMGETG